MNIQTDIREYEYEYEYSSHTALKLFRWADNSTANYYFWSSVGAQIIAPLIKNGTIIYFFQWAFLPDPRRAGLHKAFQ